MIGTWRVVPNVATFDYDTSVQSFEVDEDGVGHIGIASQTKIVSYPGIGGYTYYNEGWDASGVVRLTGNGGWSQTKVAASYAVGTWYDPPNTAYADRAKVAIAAYGGLNVITGDQSGVPYVLYGAARLNDTALNERSGEPAVIAFVNATSRYGLSYLYDFSYWTDYGEPSPPSVYMRDVYDQAGLVYSSDTYRVASAWNTYGPGNDYARMIALVNADTYEYTGYTETNLGALPWAAADLHDASCIIDGDGVLHVAGKVSGQVVYAYKDGANWTEVELPTAACIAQDDYANGLVRVLLRPTSGKALLTWVDNNDAQLCVWDPTVPEGAICKSSTFTVSLYTYPSMVNESTIGYGTAQVSGGDVGNVSYVEFHEGAIRQYWSMA